MSVNWGSSPTAAINVSSTRYRPNRGQINQKHGSNVKFFATSMAHSLYRNPIRLSSLSSTLRKGSNSIVNKNSPQNPTNQPQTTITLTSIPSEPELQSSRVNPPPQPRPESLAIMSEELFHERLKARQSPLLPAPVQNNSSTTLTVNRKLSANFPSTSSFLLDKHCIEDVTYSTTNQFISTDQKLKTQITPPPSPEGEEQKQQEEKEFIETKPDLIESSKEKEEEEEKKQEPEIFSSPIKAIINYSVDSSDESWRLLNSNSSLDEHIPYIDETDFEDLGKEKNCFFI